MKIMHLFFNKNLYTCIYEEKGMIFVNALFLVIIILGVTVQSVAQKEYNKRVGGGVFGYSAAGVFFALPVFAIGVIGGFNFSVQALIYSLAFAFVYSMATVFLFLAIESGPLSITNLIVSYSLILPAAYGIIMLGEPISIGLIFGFILLLVSLMLINFENKAEPKKITLKWVIYVAVAFLCNGACSIVQRLQQINCKGEYKNEFMIIALAISTLSMAIIAAVNEKKNLLTDIKKGIGWCALHGISNGVVNLLIIVLALRMPASVSFPIISAGGIVAAFIISVTMYKEKLSKPQLVALVLGVASVILLNL